MQDNSIKSWAFSGLNIQSLEQIAARWVADHRRTDLGDTPLTINRIVLYHWATPYQRYHESTVRGKYGVVFELPYERLHSGDIFSGDPLEKFIGETQFFGAPPEKTALLYDDFSAVYETAPGNEYYKDWRFIPMYRGFSLPEQVRVGEGCVVLYDKSNKNYTEKSVDERRAKTHKPDNKEILNKAIHSVSEDVDQLYNGLKSLLKANRLTLSRADENQQKEACKNFYDQNSNEFSILKQKHIESAIKSSKYWGSNNSARDIKGVLFEQFIVHNHSHLTSDKNLNTNPQALYTLSRKLKKNRLKNHYFF